MTAIDLVVGVVLFVVLAVLLGGFVLVIRLSWWLMHAPSRPAPPFPPLRPPPDDWDDEEYVARHHH
jgi:hypothetical protein